jgi:hypothetical protein
MVPARALPIPSEPPHLALVEGERSVHAPPAAEVADCVCPEYCERDHDRD